MYYIKSLIFTSLAVLFFGFMFPFIWGFLEKFNYPFVLLFYPILFIVILVFLIKNKEKIDPMVANFFQNKINIAKGIKYLSITNTVAWLIYFFIKKEFWRLTEAVPPFILLPIVFFFLGIMFFPIISTWLSAKALRQDDKFSLFLYRILNSILVLDILILMVSAVFLSNLITSLFTDKYLLF